MSGKWEILGLGTPHYVVLDPTGRAFANGCTDKQQADDVVRKLNAHDGFVAACKLGLATIEARANKPWTAGQSVLEGAALGSIRNALAAAEPEGGEDGE